MLLNVTVVYGPIRIQRVGLDPNPILHVNDGHLLMYIFMMRQSSSADRRMESVNRESIMAVEIVL